MKSLILSSIYISISLFLFFLYFLFIEMTYKFEFYFDLYCIAKLFEFLMSNCMSINYLFLHFQNKANWIKTILFYFYFMLIIEKTETFDHLLIYICVLYFIIALFDIVNLCVSLLIYYLCSNKQQQKKQ